ncbi:MAG: DUF1648 domain-containing protein [Ktedonobacterales bacterium]
MGTTSRGTEQALQAMYGYDPADNPHASPKRQRPKLRPPISWLEIALLLATFAGLLFCFLPLALAWQSLPAIVPTHFDATGHPNANGSKSALLISPLIALALTTLFVILARYPYIFNYPVTITPENALRQYRRGRLLLRSVNVFIVWLIALLQWVTLQAALGDTAVMTQIAPLLVVVGIFIPLAALTLIIAWAKRGK